MHVIPRIDSICAGLWLSLAYAYTVYIYIYISKTHTHSSVCCLGWAILVGSFGQAVFCWKQPPCVFSFSARFLLDMLKDWTESASFASSQCQSWFSPFFLQERKKDGPVQTVRNSMLPATNQKRLAPQVQATFDQQTILAALGWVAKNNQGFAWCLSLKRWF